MLGAAHRTLIVRKLKGLEEIIPYTSVHWEMLEKGKTIAPLDQTMLIKKFTDAPF